MNISIVRYLPGFLLALGISACSASGQDAVRLVEQADIKLQGIDSGSAPTGGLEHSSVRADMKGLYDEALRIADSVSLRPEDDRFVRSHAHFGLAMNRLFDVAERLEIIFDEGGVLAALRGESSEASVEGRQPYCALFADFDALQSIVELLLTTSLTPIIEDFRAALDADPEITMEIKRARYDLGQFSPEAGSNNYVEFAAVYSAPDIRLLLGGIELIAGALNFLFAYQDLFANLFLFSFVGDSPSHKQAAKLYNSNPCAESAADGNPLLSPTFGVLIPEAAAKLEAARSNLHRGFTDIGIAFRGAAQDEAASHLVGRFGAGQAWATGIVKTPAGEERFSLNVPPGSDTPLSGVLRVVNLVKLFFTTATPLIDIDAFAAIFESAGEAIASAGMWDLKTAMDGIVPSGDLVGLIEVWSTQAGRASQVPSLTDLETVFLDFGVLFAAPPGDFRRFLPEYYLQDEPYDDVDGNGNRSLQASINVGFSEADYSTSEPFIDINCNGRWDQRGDLIVQHEFEPFQDANLNGIFDIGESGPRGNLPPASIGLIGAFLDVDADGQPDRPTVDGNTVITSSADPVLCGQSAPVTWPGGVSDLDLGQGRVELGASDAITSPYGFPFTVATGSSSNYETGVNLGKVVGHYWPPRSFEFGSWPQFANMDPANGTTEKDYYFYADPTLGGWFIRNIDGKPSPGASTNAWLNRLFSQWGAVFDSLGL